MILSTKHKFIFWHIPKTAGMSIRELLQPHGLVLDHLFGQGWRQRQSTHWWHINQDDFLKENAVTGMHVRNYKEIAFVRNPYQVMVSKYNYIKGLGTLVNAHGQEVESINTQTLDQFIDRQISRQDGNWLSFPQTHWTDRPVSSHGVQVFKVEDLSSAWGELQAYLGLELPALPYQNVSDKLVTVDQLTQNQRDRIYEHFKCDFEAFGYQR